MSEQTLTEEQIKVLAFRVIINICKGGILDGTDRFYAVLPERFAIEDQTAVWSRVQREFRKIRQTYEFSLGLAEGNK